MNTVKISGEVVNHSKKSGETNGRTWHMNWFIVKTDNDDDRVKMSFIPCIMWGEPKDGTISKGCTVTVEGMLKSASKDIETTEGTKKYNDIQVQVKAISIGGAPSNNTDAVEETIGDGFFDDLND